MQIRELSSMRGIASIVVVLGHVFIVLNRPDVGDVRPLDGVFAYAARMFNGPAAVELFFVLSGLVLSLSLERRSNRNGSWLLSFYTRRLFRLYPALWVSLTLALALLPWERAGCTSGVCELFMQDAFQTDYTPTRIGLAYSGLYVHLNDPMWSLRTELFYSLLMPGIFWCLRDDRVRRPFLTLVFAIAILPMPPALYTLHYALAFTLGSAIPLLPIRRKNIPFGAIALFGVFTLVLSRIILNSLRLSDQTFEVLEMAAAFVVIYPVFHGKIDLPILRGRGVFEVGEISYSIYILHWPILYTAVFVLKDIFGVQAILDRPNFYTIVLGVMTLAIVLPLAALNFRVVEVPFQSFGRAASARVRGLIRP